MLTYELARGQGDCLYLQLYRSIRDDIENGAIASGERLPSKRALARHLNVSVMTVEGAYNQLVAEGYVYPEPRRGFFACDVNEGYGHVQPGAHEPVPHLETRDAHDGELLADLTGATAPAGVFPYAAWARAMRKVLSDESERTLLRAGEARGSYELRCAIVDYLRGYRGMEAHPDQVVVGSGAQSLYGLVIQLLGRSRTYALEDPGYPRLASIYRSNDVGLVTVGLDERGPIVGQLVQSGASVLHCMPSHQFPTGITTAVGRRRELLAWASHGDNERYLIEDDYDCEFRMEGQPVPALKSLDGNERVIYTNTFTKTLGSAFRIGYMVLPMHLAQRFGERLGFYTCPVGALEQLTLARFIESGEYERHVNRQRTHFRKIQTALVKELMREDAQGRLRFRSVGSGLHFVMEIAGEHINIDAYEQVVASRARERGVALAPMGRFDLGGCVREHPAFVMSYASLEEEVIPEVARIIVESL